MHALQPTSNKSTSLFDTHTILDIIKEYNHDFAGSNQQDAEELLQVIMNIIKEEIEDMKCSGINSLNITNEDLIDNPFEGWLTSNLICHDCRTTRPTKHQIFVDLSIPLKTPPVGDISSLLIHLPSQQYLSGSLRIIKSVIPRPPLSTHPAPTPSLATTNPLSNDKDTRNDMATSIFSSHPSDDVDIMFDSESNIDHRVNSMLNKKQLSQSRVYSPAKDARRTMKRNIGHCIELKDCLRDFTRTELLSDIECESCSSEISCTKESSKSTELQFISHTDPSEYDSEDPAEVIKRCNSPNLTTSSSVSTTTTSSVSTRTLAWKQLLVSRLPTVLCLHLSRKVHVRSYSERSYSGRNYGGEATYRQEKLRHVVRFGEKLDMSPYLDRSNDSGSGSGSSNISSTFYSSKSSDTNSGNSSSDSFVYLLRAVVVHLGSAESGHYVTYRRVQPKSGDSDCWVYVSDDVVRVVSLDDVLKAEAYMLFYELSS